MLPGSIGVMRIACPWVRCRAPLDLSRSYHVKLRFLRRMAFRVQYTQTIAAHFNLGHTCPRILAEAHLVSVEERWCGWCSTGGRGEDWTVEMRRILYK